jgi:hypothetical protein
MKLFAIITAGVLAAAGGAYYMHSEGCPFSGGCKTSCSAPAPAEVASVSDCCAVKSPCCAPQTEVCCQPDASCCGPTAECCALGLACCLEAKAVATAQVTKPDCCAIGADCCAVGAACCLGATAAK